MGVRFRFGNKPSEKFIGKWTGTQYLQYVELRILENGKISYQKHSPNKKLSYNGRARFKDDGFVFRRLFRLLQGTYIEEKGSEPKLIINGIILTKRSNNFKEKNL